MCFADELSRHGGRKKNHRRERERPRKERGYAAIAPMIAEERVSALIIPRASVGEKISTAPAFKASAHISSSANR
ncbi:MAG: hypothetical protein DMG91_09320 [Acidobacteria bacterium]|nr:MAG: hypothetical protein DMG91_09320 [Acidobacteriota bacterium]